MKGRIQAQRMRLKAIKERHDNLMGQAFRDGDGGGRVVVVVGVGCDDDDDGVVGVAAVGDRDGGWECDGEVVTVEVVCRSMAGIWPAKREAPENLRGEGELTNEVPRVFSNPPNIDPHMEPFYICQTEILNHQVQLRDEQRGGIMSIGKGIKNLLKGKKKNEEDDTTTHSPIAKSSSPSPPNAPLKTLSTKDTSSTFGTTSSSFESKPQSSPPSSNDTPSPQPSNLFLDYIMDVPPRPLNPIPLQSHPSLDITLSLFLITPLDYILDTPSPPSPQPPPQLPLIEVYASHWRNSSGDPTLDLNNLLSRFMNHLWTSELAISNLGKFSGKTSRKSLRNRYNLKSLLLGLLLYFLLRFLLSDVYQADMTFFLHVLQGLGARDDIQSGLASSISPIILNY
ncbi:hypothetical protein Tco_1106606 [Tanacetum coccineum]